MLWPLAVVGEGEVVAVSHEPVDFVVGELGLVVAWERLLTFVVGL